MRKQTTPATQPAKLGTVYTATARIQVIGYDDMWDTLATCLDTPNAIAAAITKVRKDHPNTSLWVSGEVSGRKYHGQK